MLESLQLLRGSLCDKEFPDTESQSFRALMCSEFLHFFFLVVLLAANLYLLKPQLLFLGFDASLSYRV